MGNVPMLAKYNRKQKVSLFDSKPVSSQHQSGSALSSLLVMPRAKVHSAHRLLIPKK